MEADMVKQYLRIDTDADDDLLEMMMMAAEEYIIGAVGAFDEKSNKAKLLFLAIMQDLYENRTFTIKDAEKRRLAYTQGSIILQLQCEREVDDG